MSIENALRKMPWLLPLALFGLPMVLVLLILLCSN